MILKVTLLFEKEKAGQRINYKTQTGENHTNFESRKCIFHFNCIDTRCNTDACKNILQFICFDFFSIYISSPSIIIRDGEKKHFIALGSIFTLNIFVLEVKGSNLILRDFPHYITKFLHIEIIENPIDFPRALKSSF